MTFTWWTFLKLDIEIIWRKVFIIIWGFDSTSSYKYKTNYICKNIPLHRSEAFDIYGNKETETQSTSRLQAKKLTDRSQEKNIKEVCNISSISILFWNKSYYYLYVYFDTSLKLTNNIQNLNAWNRQNNIFIIAD